MKYDFVDSVGFDDATDVYDLHDYSKWNDRDMLQWARGKLAGLATAHELIMSGKDPHPETGEATVGLIKLRVLEDWIAYQEERITALLNLQGDDE